MLKKKKPTLFQGEFWALQIKIFSRPGLCNWCPEGQTLATRVSKQVAHKLLLDFHSPYCSCCCSCDQGLGQDSIAEGGLMSSQSTCRVPMAHNQHNTQSWPALKVDSPAPGRRWAGMVTFYRSVQGSDPKQNDKYSRNG